MFSENLEQIEKLINMVSSSDIAELSVKEGNLEVTVKKKVPGGSHKKECDVSVRPPFGSAPSMAPYPVGMPNPAMGMGMPGFDVRMQQAYMPMQPQAIPAIPAVPTVPAAAAVPAAPAQTVSEPVPEKKEIVEGNKVESPLVGTFYVASSPDAEPFVKKGDTVKKGQVLGIIEAMKLMNEIECEFDGVVADILVANGDMVEYGQPLFIIK